MSCCATVFQKYLRGMEDSIYGLSFLNIFQVKVWLFKRGFLTPTFGEFGSHPVDREPFIMCNTGGLHSKPMSVEDKRL